jgi:hypothetical protein
VSRQDQRHQFLLRRHHSNPNACLFDEDQRAGSQRRTGLSKCYFKSGKHVGRTNRSQTQQHHSAAMITSDSGDLAKIEIERHDDPPLSPGTDKYRLIRQTPEADLPQVYRIMAACAQWLRNAARHIHIEQQTHSGYANSTSSRASHAAYDSA